MAKQTIIEGQLRAAILGAGITRYQIGLRSGVSQASLSLFVSGKRGLTLDTAAKIAAALGLELAPTKRAKKGKVNRGKRSA